MHESTERLESENTVIPKKIKKKEKPVLNKNTIPDQYNLKTKPMLSIHEVPPPPSFPPILGTTVWTLL